MITRVKEKKAVLLHFPFFSLHTNTMSHSGRKYRETYQFELEWSRKEGQGEH